MTGVGDVLQITVGAVGIIAAVQRIVLMAYGVGEQSALMVVGIFAEQQTLLTLLFAARLVDVLRQRRAVEVDGRERAALGVLIIELAVVRQAHAFELAAGVVGVTQRAPALMLGDQPVPQVVFEGQRMFLAVVDASQPTEAVVLVDDLAPVRQGLDQQAPGRIALVARDQHRAVIAELGLFQQMTLEVVGVGRTPPVEAGFLSDQSGRRVVQPILFARLVLDFGEQQLRMVVAVLHPRAVGVDPARDQVQVVVIFETGDAPEHFDERLFATKPHPGQMQVAAWIRQDLAIDAPTAPLHRLQDRYSLRCAPHVLGVLADSLSWLRGFIETELNSANDNPIIDAEEERVLHGGHFYGGHIAFAMDSLKTLVANVADLLDRQLALLVDVRYNHGLPSNLSGASAERAMLNHGFKAVQIGTSAWTAEALKNTMPASVFSRSTECHNQDKVSMGTIAARDAIRVLELTEQVAAATLLAAHQGVWLRSRAEDARPLPPALAQMHAELAKDFAPVVEDRALEAELRLCLSRIAQQHWRLHA